MPPSLWPVVSKKLTRAQSAATGEEFVVIWPVSLLHTGSCQSGRPVLWCPLSGEFSSRTADAKPSQVPTSRSQDGYVPLVPRKLRKDLTSLATLIAYTGLRGPSVISWCPKWVKENHSQSSLPSSHTGLLSASLVHCSGSRLRASGLELPSAWDAFPPDYHQAGSLAASAFLQMSL